MAKTTARVVLVPRSDRHNAWVRIQENEDEGMTDTIELTGIEGLRAAVNDPDGPEMWLTYDAGRAHWDEYANWRSSARLLLPDRRWRRKPQPEAKDEGSRTRKCPISRNDSSAWITCPVPTNWGHSEVEVTVRRLDAPKEPETDWEQNWRTCQKLLTAEREAHAKTKEELELELGRYKTRIYKAIVELTLKPIMASELVDHD